MSTQDAEERLISLLSGYYKYQETAPDNYSGIQVIPTITLVEAGLALAAALLITKYSIIHSGPAATSGTLVLAVAFARRSGGWLLGWAAAISALAGFAYMLPPEDSLAEASDYVRIVGLSLAILAVMMVTPGSFGPIKPNIRRLACRIKESLKDTSSASFSVAGGAARGAADGAG